MAHTNGLCPLGNRLRLSTKANLMGAAGVVALLLLSRPPAVARFVIPVVVDAVELVLRAWPFSHVPEEVRKIFPFITYRYSSPAVVLIAGGFWISYPLEHPRPYGVFPFSRHAMLCMKLIRQAAATSCFASTQTV